MIKKILIIFLAIIFPFNSGFLYSSESLSLDFLIKEARDNNPEILAAKKRWEASLAWIPQAKSLNNPSVGFSFMKIPKGTLKLDNTMSQDRVLFISQMFPFFGKLSLKGKIAIAQSQMAASEYKNNL